MNQSTSESPKIPGSSVDRRAGSSPAPSTLLDGGNGLPSDSHLTISGMTVHADRARKCTMRDIAEPVSFLFTARLGIVISRFADVPPVPAERLAEMVRETLAEGGINVLAP